MCQVVNRHLSLLCTKHLGTRFVRINAEKSPFLAEKLSIIILPSICMVIKGKIKDWIMGFDDLGGTADFTTETLEWRLGVSGVLQYEGDLEGPPKPVKSVKGRHMIKGKARAGREGWESDSDEDF